MSSSSYSVSYSVIYSAPASQHHEETRVVPDVPFDGDDSKSDGELTGLPLPTQPAGAGTAFDSETEQKALPALHHAVEGAAPPVASPPHQPAANSGNPEEPSGENKSGPAKGRDHNADVPAVLVASAGVVGAVGVASVVTVPVVQGIGFTAGGVAAKSTGAWLMSKVALVSGGAIAKGSSIAALQSAGATSSLAPLLPFAPYFVAAAVACAGAYVAYDHIKKMRKKSEPKMDQ